MKILDLARGTGLIASDDKEAIKRREQDLISFGYYQGVLDAAGVLKSSPDDDQGMTEAEVQRNIEMLVKRLYEDVIPLSDAERIWEKGNLRQPGVPIEKWKLGRDWVTTRQEMIKLYGEPDASKVKGEKWTK
jgi:hypothetical protein